MTIDEYILDGGLGERMKELKHLNIAWASTRVDSADEDEEDVEDDACYYAEGEEYLMKQDLWEEEEEEEEEEYEEYDEEEEEWVRYRNATREEIWHDDACTHPKNFRFLPNLTTLELHGCRDETAFSILKKALLTSNLPNLTSLKVANYGEVMTTDDCIDILDAMLTGNLQGVKSLDISGNFIHRQAMQKLYELILRGLSYLNVARNSFGDSGGIMLRTEGVIHGCRVETDLHLPPVYWNGEVI
jgi:hypothetical protein